MYARCSRLYVLLALLCACWSASREELINSVRAGLGQQGEILDEWQVEGVDHLLLRENDSVHHMVIRYVEVGRNKEATSDVLHSVDAMTHTCSQARARNPVPCERVREDPRLAPYITWNE